MTGRTIRGVVGAVLVGGLCPILVGREADRKAEPVDDPVSLVDCAGKEIKLTGVKLTLGTRRLGWLAEATGATDEMRKGMLALEVRELHSTTYQKGVATLIPAGSVEAIRYEYDKQRMSVEVKGLTDRVTGTLQFQKINVLALEGVAGGMIGKFGGGVAKDGFRSVIFPGAKPLPARPPGGTSWTVQIDQLKAGHPTLPVRNLKVLYQFTGGTEQLLGSLPVRKGNPLPLDTSLKKLEVVAVDLNTHTAVFEVVLEGGAGQLIAVPLLLEQDRRAGTLVGLVGEVGCGWKLFPLHTIKVVKPEEKKEQPTGRP